MTKSSPSLDAREYVPLKGDGPRTRAVLDKVRTFQIKGKDAVAAVRETRYEDWLDANGREH